MNFMSVFRSVDFSLQSAHDWEMYSVYIDQYVYYTLLLSVMLVQIVQILKWYLFYFATLIPRSTVKCCECCILLSGNTEHRDARLSLFQQVTGGYYGLGMPVLFLRGSNVQRLPDRFRTMPGFGDGKYRSEKWWKAFGESAFISRHQFYFVMTRTWHIILCIWFYVVQYHMDFFISSQRCQSSWRRLLLHWLYCENILFWLTRFIIHT